MFEHNLILIIFLKNQIIKFVVLFSDIYSLNYGINSNNDNSGPNILAISCKEQAKVRLTFYHRNFQFLVNKLMHFY